MSDDELDLLLRGLFELTIGHVDDDRLRQEARAIAERLGGNPDAMFFGAHRYLRHTSLE